jgi:hypothetical protein
MKEVRKKTTRTAQPESPYYLKTASPVKVEEGKDELKRK